MPPRRSGCPDLNWGPLRPERSALPGCATPRRGASMAQPRGRAARRSGRDGYAQSMGRCLRVMPVGGLDEVGRNMTLVAWGQERIVVDCGVGFPRGADRGGPVEQLL